MHANAYILARNHHGMCSAQKIISAFTSKSGDPMTIARQTFQVSKGATNVLLPIDAIAYFFREGDSNYLRTFNGEDYFVNTTLDEVQQQLPEEAFFRANRQLILGRHACKSYNLLDYGKLNVRLDPQLVTGAVVSQKRAKEFKRWLDHL